MSNTTVDEAVLAQQLVLIQQTKKESEREKVFLSQTEEQQRLVQMQTAAAARLVVAKKLQQQLEQEEKKLQETNVRIEFMRNKSSSLGAETEAIVSSFDRRQAEYEEKRRQKEEEARALTEKLLADAQRIEAEAAEKSIRIRELAAKAQEEEQQEAAKLAQLQAASAKAKKDIAEQDILLKRLLSEINGDVVRQEEKVEEEKEDEEEEVEDDENDEEEDDDDEDDDDEDDDDEKVKLGKRRRQQSDDSSNGGAKKLKVTELHHVFAPIGKDVFQAGTTEEQALLRPVRQSALSSMAAAPLDRQFRSRALRNQIGKDEAIVLFAHFIEDHYGKSSKSSCTIIVEFGSEASELFSLALVANRLQNEGLSFRSLCEAVLPHLSRKLASKFEQNFTVLTLFFSHLNKLAKLEGLIDQLNNAPSWERAWQAGVLSEAPLFSVVYAQKIEEYQKALPLLRQFWSTAVAIKKRAVSNNDDDNE